jgi:hypothetical protein
MGIAPQQNPHHHSRFVPTNRRSPMKKIALSLAIACFALPAFAEKNCDELKSEIAAKIEAKGVKNAQLEIVAADQVKDEKVVGSCEGGKKKITYKKG